MDNEIEVESRHYQQEELESLRNIFDIFDRDQSGFIEAADMNEIMEKIGKNPDDAAQILATVDPNNDGRISFQEFVTLLEQIELSLQQNDDPLDLINQETETYDDEDHQNDKVSEFLDILNQYRMKFEAEGNYQEALKAKSEYDELRAKEVTRKFQNMRGNQYRAKEEIETAQKTQFMEFSNAWDNYMSDYENTAYISLEKLKEKQLFAFQEFQQKTRQEAQKRIKNSKELLELRKKQATLAKIKQYEQADLIKRKADALEEWESTRKEAEIESIVQKK